MKHLGIIIILLSLSGCVGLAYVQGDTKDIKTLTEHSSKPEINIEKLTRIKLSEIKGAPDEVSTNKWTYYLSESRKFGLMPAFIIPIPLIFPFQKEKIVYEFKDGYVIKATYYTSKDYGGFCGLVPYNHFDFKLGCI